MKIAECGCLFLFICVFVLLSTTRLEGMDDAKLKKYIEDSQQVTNSWLVLVDQGKYGESWDAASNNFQLTIKRDEWIKALQKLREPLGKVKTRDVLDIRWATDPKGLPKGDYMVFFYRSNFDRKDKVFELVTLIQAADGKWKILTYEIQ